MWAVASVFVCGNGVRGKSIRRVKALWLPETDQGVRWECGNSVRRKSIRRVEAKKKKAPKKRREGVGSP